MITQQYSSFLGRVRAAGLAPLTACDVGTLQVNLGSLCNMACRHCHVSAGPACSNIMSRSIVDEVVSVLSVFSVPALDITGGAPELNPWFRHLVRSARKLGKSVMVRTNLTVFFESGMGDLPEFFSEHGLDVAASLPSYREELVDLVRGRGAFRKSIDALRRLNAAGYGESPHSGKLYLVHNPPDANIPVAQEALEQEYRSELRERHGISFTGLYALANAPIGRFLDALEQSGALERYQEALGNGFNARALDTVMCRRMINVGWDGRLHDCDFNQALGIGLLSEPKHISCFDPSLLAQRIVNTGEHCYACTAGRGFS